MIGNKRKKLQVIFVFTSVFCVVSKAEQNVVKSVKDLKYKLNSGDWMPMIGFGTWKTKGEELIKNSLDYALDAGFRHIDTAQSYENEEEIGKALKMLLPKYNLTRQDIFITSKISSRIPNADGYQSVKDSLEKLQTDYIDLYLIHNPAIIENGTKPDGTWTRVLSKGPLNAEIRDKKWQALVKAKKEGLVKNIGVSNYAVKHLKELLANDYGVKPVVNQILWNPFFQPRDILEFCKKENILVVGYSSLGSNEDSFQLRNDPRVKKIAEKLGKTASQVLLRWVLQEGIAIIPKTSSKKHVEEDIELDFVLPEEDVKILNAFEEKEQLFDIRNID